MVWFGLVWYGWSGIHGQFEGVWLRDVLQRGALNPETALHHADWVLRPLSRNVNLCFKLRLLRGYIFQPGWKECWKTTLIIFNGILVFISCFSLSLVCVFGTFQMQSLIRCHTDLRRFNNNPLPILRALQGWNSALQAGLGSQVRAGCWQVGSFCSFSPLSPDKS